VSLLGSFNTGRCHTLTSPPETLPAQAREVLAASPTLLAYLIDRLALVGNWQNFEADALQRGGCPRGLCKTCPSHAALV
jgi:hypothetical protein